MAADDAVGRQVGQVGQVGPTTPGVREDLFFSTIHRLRAGKMVGVPYGEEIGAYLAYLTYFPGPVRRT